MDTIARLKELTGECGISLYRLSQLCDISYSTLKNAEARSGQLSLDQFSEADYSEELLTLLSYLANNHRSARDSRIGKAILQSINQGYVLKETYANNNEEDKWPSDMEFAEQIGLVNKIDDDCFFILKQIDHRFDLLNEMQRKRATELYNSFGSNFFSQKMVVAELSYSDNVTKAILHTFRLLRILDCRKDGINMYQFLVNPEENPECFWPAA